MRARKQDESTTDFLRRSGHPVAVALRGLINSWHAQFPEGSRAELASRLTSARFDTFHSAFFELYLHELLRRLGCVVEVHPELNGERSSSPDFLVREPGGRHWFLEAVLASETSNRDRGRESLQARVFQAIDEIESPDFWLHARARGELEASPSTNLLKREIRDWLETLDYESCREKIRLDGGRELPRFERALGAWRLTIQASAKSRAHRGLTRTLGFQSRGDSRQVKTADALRKAVKRKAGKYGHLDGPFCVAVNAMESIGEPGEIARSLYGSEPALHLGRAGDWPIERNQDGVFGRSDRHSRVSGVLVFQMLFPTTSRSVSARMWLNPDATHPLGGTVLQLPVAEYVDDSLRYRLGFPPGAVLGLPDDWLPITG